MSRVEMCQFSRMEVTSLNVSFAAMHLRAFSLDFCFMSNWAKLPNTFYLGKSFGLIA